MKNRLALSVNGRKNVSKAFLPYEVETMGFSVV